jgi:hypothetical protein
MRKRIAGLAAAILILAFQVAGRGGDADHAKALVTKAIAASGGAAKVALLQAGACKAKANIQDNGQQINFALDVTWQGWDQYRVTVAADFNGMAKNAVLVINGGKVWAKTDDKQTEEAPKQDVPMITGMLQALRMPHMLPALLDKDFKLAPLGEIKIGDRAALGVTVTHKDRQDVSLFFDKENGLPAKSEIHLTDPRGKEITFEFLYQDYKETNGLKHCTRVNAKAAGKEFIMELNDLKAQGKVEPGLFAAPE